MSFRFLSLLLWAIVCICVASKGELFASDEYVKEIFSLDELGKVKHTKNANIVLFYSHFCPHCQNYAPVYKKLSQSMATTHPELKFYAYDCVNLDCSSSGIRAYPTLKAYGVDWDPEGMEVKTKEIEDFISTESKKESYKRLSRSSSQPSSPVSGDLLLSLKNGESLLDFSKIILTDKTTTANIFPPSASEIHRWPQSTPSTFARRLQDVKFALSAILSKFGQSLDRASVLSELFVLDALSRAIPVKNLSKLLWSLRNSYLSYLNEFLTSPIITLIQADGTYAKIDTTKIKISSIHRDEEFRKGVRSLVFADLVHRLDLAIDSQHPSEAATIPVRIFNPTTHQGEGARHTKSSDNTASSAAEESQNKTKKPSPTLLVTSGMCVSPSTAVTDNRFPCSLWTLLHMIAAHVAQPPQSKQGLLSPASAQILMRTLVDSFFPCSECRRHFVHSMDNQLELDEVKQMVHDNLVAETHEDEHDSQNLSSKPGNTKPPVAALQTKWMELTLKRDHPDLIEFDADPANPMKSFYSTIVEYLNNTSEEHHDTNSALVSLSDINSMFELIQTHQKLYVSSLTSKLESAAPADRVWLSHRESFSTSLWLWSLHNAVTRRLASDPFHSVNWLPDLQRPQDTPSMLNNHQLYMKYLWQDVRYPAEHLCPQCYLPSVKNSPSSGSEEHEDGDDLLLVGRGMISLHALRTSPDADVVILGAGGEDPVGTENLFLSIFGFDLEQLLKFLDFEYRSAGHRHAIKMMDQILMMMGKKEATAADLETVAAEARSSQDHGWVHSLFMEDEGNFGFDLSDYDGEKGYYGLKKTFVIVDKKGFILNAVLVCIVAVLMIIISCNLRKVWRCFNHMKTSTGSRGMQQGDVKYKHIPSGARRSDLDLEAGGVAA
eukprot:GDKJ01057315.1.p1 GENE.GDKJ01057315.1~~GDKJ01057315.1.p1  ORF type:complete len:889 (+),score=159.31 GDKJ01057315.1:39-2705(+)